MSDIVVTQFDLTGVKFLNSSGNLEEFNGNVECSVALKKDDINKRIYFDITFDDGNKKTNLKTFFDKMDIRKSPFFKMFVINRIKEEKESFLRKAEREIKNETYLIRKISTIKGLIENEVLNNIASYEEEYLKNKYNGDFNAYVKDAFKNFVQGVDTEGIYEDLFEEYTELWENKAKSIRDSNFSIMNKNLKHLRDSVKLLIEKAKNERIQELTNARFHAGLSAVQGYLGNLTSVMDSFMSAGYAKNRRWFEVYKALRVAQTIIDTYASAQKAMAQLPYPINMTMAGIAVATGMMRLAVIKAQRYHTGGFVDRATFNNSSMGGLRNDEIPTILQRGEYV